MSTSGARGVGPHYGTAVAAAMKAGNLIAQGQLGAKQQQQYGELSATSKQEQLRHAALLKRVDAERRARKIVVPTNDIEVRGMLRKLGHPVRLFGESVAEVRERLREILARIEIEGEERELVASLLAKPDPLAPHEIARLGPAPRSDASRESKTDVFTAASAALVDARGAIAESSFAKAAARLETARRKRDEAEPRDAHERETAELYAALHALSLQQSQFADARPVARIRSSPAAPLVATGSWSGVAKIWDVESCVCKCALKGHKERITGLAWAPKGSGSLESLRVLTGAADSTAKLWDVRVASEQRCDDDVEMVDGIVKGVPSDAAAKAKANAIPEGKLLMTFAGHRERLGNVEWHPDGAHVGTTSFDHTWRFWDVETGTELLLQDGHARETYAIAFQRDGALVATGDFAGIVHLWDIRSGKLVHSALGHGKKILAADWSPDGYQLATGSDDHTVRIWDLRRKECSYTLPAHSALISDVRWSPTSGEALATASFDGSVGVWSTRDWSSLAALSAHDGKSMSVDFAPMGVDTSIVTCGFDRTFKIWTAQD